MAYGIISVGLVGSVGNVYLLYELHALVNDNNISDLLAYLFSSNKKPRNCSFNQYFFLLLIARRGADVAQVCKTFANHTS